MSDVVEKYIAANPFEIGLLGLIAVMPRSQHITNLVKQFRGMLIIRGNLLCGIAKIAFFLNKSQIFVDLTCSIEL